MSETLSTILYNGTNDTAQEKEDNSYEAALAKTQDYLSRNHAATLAETVLQEDARETVRFLIEQYLIGHKVYVSGMDIQELVTRLYRDMAGYSILEEPLADPDVEEIFVNGYDDIEIVDDTGRHKTSLRFANKEQAQDITRRLIRLAGKTIDAMHPLEEAHLTMGVRIAAIFPPVAPEEDGVYLSIRKQRQSSVTRDQLLRWGAASEEVLDFLELCLNHGVSFSVAGKTGSGKTTLLTYLLNNLDPSRRIITIEETREILILNPRDEEGRKTKSILSLCTRPSDDSKLDINMTKLLKITLRKRPCIITMAEMRGAEAVDTREAARTGHTVISSLHANSASQAYSRIMTMCQMGDETISVQILMHTIVDAFPIAVFCGEAGPHHRCVLQIVEAYGVMDGQVRTNVLFQYEEDESGWRWVRKKGISKRLAEILLNHRADPKTVEMLMAEPGR